MTQFWALHLKSTSFNFEHTKQCVKTNVNTAWRKWTETHQYFTVICHHCQQSNESFMCPRWCLIRRNSLYNWVWLLQRAGTEINWGPRKWGIYCCFRIIPGILWNTVQGVDETSSFLYPIHLTLCSEMLYVFIGDCMSNHRLCFLNAIKVEFHEVCVNTSTWMCLMSLHISFKCNHFCIQGVKKKQNANSALNLKLLQNYYACSMNWHTK